MNNNNGFTFIELIFSLSVFLLLTTSLLPLLTHVRTMQNDQAIERYGYSQLQDHLYEVPVNALPLEIKDSKYPIVYRFMIEGNYVKGCTDFSHQPAEELCLYAHKLE